MTNVLDTLKVPLAIGTLQWGTTPIDHKIINPRGVISEAQAQQIVQEFTKAGVQVWDTAEGYGGGTSEKRLSRCLKDSNDAIFMTKFLPVPWRGFWESDFENAVRQSCLRLGVKTIPLYLLHTPVHWRPLEYWVKCAARCKELGVIQYLGLSNCNASQVRRAVEAGKEFGIDVVLNQVHFSLLDYNSPALLEMATTCRELNVKIVAFSPIGQGLLTDKLTQDNFGSNRPAKMLRLEWDDLAALRAGLKRMSAKYEKTMAQVAIQWCIRHKVVPLVGCRSLEQAKDTLGSLGWEMEAKDVETLNNLALDRSTLQSPEWRRSIFVTLFGIIMVVCRTMDALGFGMVKEASV